MHQLTREIIIKNILRKPNSSKCLFDVVEIFMLLPSQQQQHAAATTNNNNMGGNYKFFAFIYEERDLIINSSTGRRVVDDEKRKGFNGKKETFAFLIFSLSSFFFAKLLHVNAENLRVSMCCSFIRITVSLQFCQPPWEASTPFLSWLLSYDACDW